MNLRQAKAHMKAAYVYADLSYCTNDKVGCIIVKDNRVISIGYNGTLPGEDNCCEDESGNTLPTVIHAEDNAIKKLENTAENSEDVVLFVTRAPCYACAEIICNFGIKNVLYDVPYRRMDGVEYLKNHGVSVDQLTVQ